MVEAVTHEAPVMAWGDVYREIVEGAADPLLLAVHGTVVVVSPAIEFKAEGFVTGMAAKMFTIAGPVIVYGTLASVVYGLVYWLTKIL